MITYIVSGVVLVLAVLAYLKFKDSPFAKGLLIATVSLVSLVLFQKKRSETAQAIVDNMDVTKKVNEVDKAIIENQAKIAAEQGTVNQIEKKEYPNVSKEEIVDFINSLSKRTK